MVQKGDRPTAAAKIAFSVLAGLIAAAVPACRPRVLLAPVPAEMVSLEGHGSLKISLRGESGRSKFSFFLEPDRRGRLTVSDLLNRTLVVIYLVGPDAYVVPSSSRIYWKATPEEVVEKFLGFRLSLADIVGLFSGRWDGSRLGESQGSNSWSFERDGQGRAVAGRRGDFFFSVREFFSRSDIPRRLDFSSPLGEGRLTLLAVGFNRPASDGLFALAFLRTHAPAGWSEIERILRDED